MKPLKLTTKKVPRYNNGEFKDIDTGEIEATPENLKKIEDEINNLYRQIEVLKIEKTTIDKLE